MKNHIIFLIVSFLIINICSAGELKHRLEIANINTKTEKFEFDIILKNETSENFLYSAGQYFIELNNTTLGTSLGLCEIIESDLPLELQPRNPQCKGNLLMLASNNINRKITYSISDKSVLIARIRVNFPKNSSSKNGVNLKWLTDNAKRKTTIVVMQNDGELQTIKTDQFFSESDSSPKLLRGASKVIPNQFALGQNFPNPFNPETIIKFDIPIDLNNKSINVRLIVYDITGRETLILLNDQLEAGKYEIKFSGNNFASGVYFYKITAGDFVSVKRMILLK